MHYAAAALPAPVHDVAASPSSSCTSISRQQTPEESTEALIPGLSHDLAFYCLFRLPLASQAVARLVSKSWLVSLSSREYFQGRRGLGFTEQWLCVLAFHKSSGKIQWQAFDPLRQKWHLLPAMPCKGRVCPPGFGCASIADQGVLFVCGGMQTDMDCPMDSVLKYEMRKNRWTVAGKMSTPRSFFASGMIDGRIYAAGGNSADRYLSSAEVYDPVMDLWRPVASMGTNMARYDAAVLDGKLYVTEGWSWPFLYSPRGQIYDPKADRWENMRLGMREGWTGLSVVLDGHLFIISDLEDSVKLKVYDTGTDSWRCVSGSAMPPNMVKPFSVNTLNGKLLVVARSLHVAIGKVTHTTGAHDMTSAATTTTTSVEWHSVAAPHCLADFVPSNSQVLHGWFDGGMEIGDSI
ncbi:hypothetical protein SELMODRAFT_183002 [Selaginella moellendorffii]|uniref:FKB95-like N-terminal Kelch domain-containing protein n=1 Tax=Selaginella moellendorffii TaxID=88036 RepID=D8SV93_SELML|nr:F-box/kelch-repeat protein At1g30090 [Selaginella moellendorffii]EFJ11629.1 hypothetical protein SELMODRAFT_183002 [Selaginella moellendorffii]|eukprot:XP_002987314.1 F-box/kelch-repeat protein At1g30090 [Selaginella moellendorffii]